MCTSLTYKDAAGKVYLGRTLELTSTLPYELAFFPRGADCSSKGEGTPPLNYKRAHGFVAITMPGRLPTAEAPIGPADLKVIEGLNDSGLTFSMQSYPITEGPQNLDMSKATLSVADLGAWILGTCQTVAQVRTALADQPVQLTPLAIIGNIVPPFHFVTHDRTGASLVIEFTRGVMALHDNPVGVMTNAPPFDWHLTNLNNYTYLSNVDSPTATFGSFEARQPDYGVATTGLPASSTSVGRFVRAAYYAQFTEAADTPDMAVQTVGHIMNNFDRPRGATVDLPGGDTDNLDVQGAETDAGKQYETEFTSWTSLSDLNRGLLFVRDYKALNYVSIDLGALADVTEPRMLPLAKLTSSSGDVTAAVRAAA